jgi:hypothetical protein
MSQNIQTPILVVKRNNTITGDPIVINRTMKGKKYAVPQAIITTEYGEFWLPSQMVADEHNVLNLTVYNKGDIMQAEAPTDSARTKGEVLTPAELTALATKTGKPEAELKDEPLYFQGDPIVASKTIYRAESTGKYRDLPAYV